MRTRAKDAPPQREDLPPLPRGQHRRVGVVHNPTSRKGRYGGAVDLVRLTLVRLGYDVLAVAGEDYDATRRAATGLLDDQLGLDALIVIGGDGMVHLGLDVVATTPVPLGIVPVGTGNDIARHFGIPAQDVPAAVRLIHAGLTGHEEAEIRAVDAIHCTRPDGTPVADEHEWSMAIVSAGFDAAVNARANTLHWPSGEGRYLRAIPYELGNLRPYGYRITTEAGVWEGAGLLMAVANTSYFGGGLQITPEADPTDGLLDLVRLDPVGRTALLGHLARLRQGTHLGHPGTHAERSRFVMIEHYAGPESPEAGEEPALRRPPHPMADGEPIADLPIRLEAVPAAVRLIVPGAQAEEGPSTPAEGAPHTKETA